MKKLSKLRERQGNRQENKKGKEIFKIINQYHI